MTALGVALIAAGVAWWQWPNLAYVAHAVIGAGVQRVTDDPRPELFRCFMVVSDHVATVGSPEEKAALLVVLPSLVEKTPE